MVLEHERFAEIASGAAPYFIRRLTLDRLAPSHVTRVEQTPGLLVERDFYDLFVNLRGTSEVDVLGSDGTVRTARLRPGRVVHGRPQDHRYRGFRMDGPLEFYEVGISSRAWESFTSMIGVAPELLTAPAAPSVAFHPRHDPIAGFFEELNAATPARAPMEALVRFLIEVVPRLYSPGRAREVQAPPWLSAGVETMRDEENLRAGMPRFLQLTHVGPRQLARLTQRYFARTPHAIVAEARLHHAMRLLRSGTDSISVVAQRCGYGSAAYFSYSFREETGTSPSEFRKRGPRGSPGA